MIQACKYEYEYVTEKYRYDLLSKKLYLILKCMNCNFNFYKCEYGEMKLNISKTIFFFSMTNPKLQKKKNERKKMFNW